MRERTSMCEHCCGDIYAQHVLGSDTDTGQWIHCYRKDWVNDPHGPVPQPDDLTGAET